MNINQRIKYLKEFVSDNANHVAFHEELENLLQQVAKEQRKICVEEWAMAGDTHGEESQAIFNAPSPIDKYLEEKLNV